MVAQAAGKGADLGDVVRGLQSLVGELAPGVTETVNPWGMPTFESNGPFCYYKPAQHHVTFGFLRGTSLDDPHGLLEGTGKSLRHVKLRTMDDLRRVGLRELVQAAVELNRSDPQTGMPKRKP